MEQFNALMTKHVASYGAPTELCLNGEGEPTLNKHLFDMAAWGKSIGARVSTVTNGSYKYPEKFIGLFDEVSLSVESLSEDKSNKLGRFGVHNTLQQALYFKAYGINVIINHVQGIDPHASAEVHAWCIHHGLKIRPIPLMAKPDYSKVYPVHFTPLLKRPQTAFKCKYVAQDLWRFYNIDGIEMPCCFIKDHSKFTSIADLRERLNHDVPPPCVGCVFA
jgi:molybdenum cofactor biosynthesis enzyme MoaA